MKKLLTILTLSAALFASCKPDGNLTSGFEFSARLSMDKIVDSTATTLTVSSSRNWILLDQRCDDRYPGDINFEKITDLFSASEAFGAGTLTFNVPADAIKVKETHKGRFTLKVKDVETGSEKEVTSAFSAYHKNAYSFRVDNPVVHNGENLRFSVYSPTSEWFTLKSFTFELADESIQIGKTYKFDASHRVEFSVPVKISKSIIDGDIFFDIVDETGEQQTIHGKGCYSAISMMTSLSADNVQLYSAKHGWTPQSINISCEGGFTVSVKDDTDGQISLCKSRNGVFDGTEYTFDSQSSAQVFFCGRRPGNATIVVKPLAAKGQDTANEEIDVWVKPRAVLYVDGTFSHTINRALWTVLKIDNGAIFDKRTWTYIFYEGKASGGWTAAPTRIGFKMLPADAEFSLPTDAEAGVTLSGAQASATSLYGLANGLQQAYSAEAFKTAAGDGFASQSMTKYGQEFGESTFSVTFKSAATAASSNYSSQYYWNDGQGSCMAESGSNFKNRPTSDYIKRTAVTASAQATDKQIFTYTNCPVTGYSDEVELVETYHNFTYNGSSYYPRPSNWERWFIHYYSGTPESYQALGSECYPYRVSTVRRANRAGLTWFLLKWNDVMSESGRQFGDSDESPNKYWYVPENGEAAASHRHATAWKEFSVAVSSLTYDTSLYDVVGIVYAFKVFDEESGRFLGGNDYWWRSVDHTPVFQAVKGSDITIKDNN